MASPQEKIQELDKKVSELASEIRFNETMLMRSESVLAELVELNAECKSRNDVQDERMLRILEELQHNHKDIDNLRQEAINSQNNVVNAIKELELKNASRFEKLEDRLHNLENWRWIVIGAFGVIAFLLRFIDIAPIIK